MKEGSKLLRPKFRSREEHLNWGRFKKKSVFEFSEDRSKALNESGEFICTKKAVIINPKEIYVNYTLINNKILEL